MYHFGVPHSWSDTMVPHLGHWACDGSISRGPRKALNLTNEQPYEPVASCNESSQFHKNGHYPVSFRRLHFKILTLLALSPTYSYDLEKLKFDINWDEQRLGSLQTYLLTARHEGKQLYTVNVTEGHCRIHLIKDIYLNAVSQRLRAYHEKHYKSTEEPLSADALRKFLNWDCPTRCFKDWLVNHGLSKLLSPPTRDGTEETKENLARHVRPLTIRTVHELTTALGFVKQQYNLVSLVCYEMTDPLGCPKLSLIRLTQANKQVLLIDIIALTEEAYRHCHTPQAFNIQDCEFTKELSKIMSSEDIRKCVWNFRPQRQLWKDHLGVEMNGLIDLFPICAYFFPELLQGAAADDSGMPCPQAVAEKLCPQAWGKGTEVFHTTPVSDWSIRPLSQNMIIRAGAVGVGVLLDLRKGVRTELSTRVNERMTQVSNEFHGSSSAFPTDEDCSSDLAKLLGTDTTTGLLPQSMFDSAQECPYEGCSPLVSHELRSIFSSPGDSFYSGFSFAPDDEFSRENQSSDAASMASFPAMSPVSAGFRQDPWGSQDKLNVSLGGKRFCDVSTSPTKLQSSPPPSANLTSALTAGFMSGLIYAIIFNVQMPVRRCELD